jgi:PIN domain nuclease of toxin-antitoxin system
MARAIAARAERSSGSLWVLEDSPRLSPAARTLLTDPANECWVSAVIACEIASKIAISKLTLRGSITTLETAITGARFASLNITIRHAAAVPRVSIKHADPYDRLLLAQCEVETLKLLTAGKLLKTLPQAVAAG